MTERENNVYKAKLAEQAERYDGKLNKNAEKVDEKKIFVSGAPTLGRGHIALPSRGLGYVENFAENVYISYCSWQGKLEILNFVDIYV